MEAHVSPADAAHDALDAGIQTIPAEEIDSVFRSTTIDLVSKPLGSRILSCSDEWFAEAANLTTPTPPVRKPGVFTYAGAWFDGWETRRHNRDEYDWVVIKLGVASARVQGVEIDTAFFDGNHAPEIAVQGTFRPAGDDDDDVAHSAFAGWQTILGRRACGPNRRQAWALPALTPAAFTHVRLLMYPDGGIARFRLYGSVVPMWPRGVGAAAAAAVVDLAAARHGGVAVACSDQHFGSRHNLLLPGRGVDMGDGWETKRSRGDHIDWVVVRLACPGRITTSLVDTAHFRGNFPQKVQLFAAPPASHPPSHDSGVWTEILEPQETGPDREHEYVAGRELKAVEGRTYGFVKLVIIPDGGVKRLRVFGTRA